MNEFVAEVGKAYERATENKEEADAMAKKVKLILKVIFFFLWANNSTISQKNMWLIKSTSDELNEQSNNKPKEQTNIK